MTPESDAVGPAWQFEVADHQSRLQGGVKRLMLRAIWLTLALYSVLLFCFSLPPYYDNLTRLSGPASLTPAVVWQSLAQLNISTAGYAALHVGLLVLIFVVFVGVGLFIFVRRNDDGPALLFSFILVIFGSTWPNTLSALKPIHPWLALSVDGLNLAGFTSFFLIAYLFPDGRFVPRWTAAAAVLFVSLLLVFDDGIGGPPWLAWLPAILLAGSMIVAPIVRYRGVSTPVQRQQTKWVVFSLGVALTGFFMVGFLENVPAFNQPGRAAILFDLARMLAYGVAFMLVPVAFGLSIMRYRLWDIDLLINRTLVYGVLTAAVVGLYFAIVGGLSAVMLTENSLALSLLATGVVAVLVQPGRTWLQGIVNRLMYGEREAPYTVLARLGRRLEATLAPDAVLPTIVATVKEALKLPYVAIALRHEEDFRVATESGQATWPPLILPLTYQNQTLGQLRLAPRGPGEAFSPADRRLMDDLVRQAGLAVQAVSLAADLQRSRERLITAREEERRRLRRDLHDGLGPTVASLSMKLDVAQYLLVENLPEGLVLLSEIQTQMQEALHGIRRLVYGLRPPALDQFGLIGTIREYALQHGPTHQLSITIKVPEPMPRLAAVLEVTTYFIIIEALTNIFRHASARRCQVNLSLAEELSLEVVDDGVGLPAEYQMGVGLTSMRERTEELGGQFSLDPVQPHGLAVRVTLPIPGS